MVFAALAAFAAAGCAERTAVVNGRQISVFEGERLITRRGEAAVEVTAMQHSVVAAFGLAKDWSPEIEEDLSRFDQAAPRMATGAPRPTEAAPTLSVGQPAEACLVEAGRQEARRVCGGTELLALHRPIPAVRKALMRFRCG